MNLYHYKLGTTCNHRNKSNLSEFCETCGAIYLKDVKKIY